jgi:hypothetical protein
MTAHHDVFDYGHVLKELHVLKGTSNAFLGDNMGSQTVNPVAKEPDSPLGETVNAGDDIVQSRLARTIWAN